MSHLKPNPLIEALPATVPFTGPETLERVRGRPFLARLGANENAFGPSPLVIEAIQSHAGDIWQYSDPESYELRQALGIHHNIKASKIMPGPGVDCLLGLIVRQYIQPGDKVVNLLGGYPTFNYHVAGYGGSIITVPYRDDHADLEALAEAAKQPGVRIVYLANPDNPLGTWHKADAIAEFIQAVPENVLIILDEAYCETAPQTDLLPMSFRRDNLLRLRTFSKAYGLAGLRCGYAIGEESLIINFDKIRDHFAITRLTQVAALAALQDQAWLQHVVNEIASSRAALYAIAADHGLSALNSATNFVAIDCGRDGLFAARVLDMLLARDIFVRKPIVPLLDRFIRVSTAPKHILDYFKNALGPALVAAGSEGE